MLIIIHIRSALYLSLSIKVLNIFFKVSLKRKSLATQLSLTNHWEKDLLPSSRKIKCSSSSTVDPGKSGLPEAISKKMQPTPL